MGSTFHEAFGERAVANLLRLYGEECTYTPTSGSAATVTVAVSLDTALATEEIAAARATYTTALATGRAKLSDLPAGEPRIGATVAQADGTTWDVVGAEYGARDFVALKLRRAVERRRRGVE